MSAYFIATAKNIYKPIPGYAGNSLNLAKAELVHQIVFFICFTTFFFIVLKVGLNKACIPKFRILGCLELLLLV